MMIEKYLESLCVGSRGLFLCDQQVCFQCRVSLPPPFYCLFDLIIVNNWRMSDKGYKICSIHVCSTASIDGVTIHRLETRADVKVFSGQFLTSSIPRY